MKIPSSRPLSLAASALVLLSPCSPAALTVIDTFDSAPFLLDGFAPGASEDHDYQFGSMFGGERYSRIVSSSALDGMGAYAAIGSGTSLLEFNCGDDPLARIVNFYAIYLTNLDLTPYSAFQLDVSNLQGSGLVRIGIVGDIVDGTYWIEAALDQVGTLTIPIVPFGPEYDVVASSGSVELHLVGTSSTFAVSLDEFRVVPEPSTSALACTALACLLFTRRREPGSGPHLPRRTDGIR